MNFKNWIRSEENRGGDEMITLPNGHVLDYVAASGSLGFDGRGWLYEWPWTHRPLAYIGRHDPRLFTVTLKSITRHPRAGNVQSYDFPWFGCFRALDGEGNALSKFDFLFRPWRVKGFLNAVGLKNCGIDEATKHYPAVIQKSGVKAIASLYADTIEDAVYIAKKFNEWPLVGLEINASCPNSGEDIAKNSVFIMTLCEEIKRVSKFPLLLKLSCENDIIPIVRVVGRWIHAISFNTVRYNTLFPDKKSPLTHLGGGGVSGGLVQLLYKQTAEKIAGNFGVPLILPVWEYTDMMKWTKFGKRYYTDLAFAFGSIFLKHKYCAFKPSSMIRKHKKEMQRVCRCAPCLLEK